MQTPGCRVAGAALLFCLSVARIAAQSPSLPQADGTYAVGDGVSPPALISKTEPEYSETATSLRADGVVGLSVVIEPDGTAGDFRVTRPLGYGLESKAIEAVRKWRFTPGMKDGSPVRVRVKFEVQFPPLRNPIPDRWFSGPMEFSIENGLTPPVVKGGTMPKPEGRLTFERLALGFTVDASGTVRNIHAVSGVPASTRLLSKYLATWQFLPATAGRQPVEAMGTVSFSRGSEDWETSTAAGLPEKIYMKGDGASEPKLMRRVDPVYPETERVKKVEGEVLLGIVIDQAGNVVNAEVLKGVSVGLGQKAIEAVMQWKFSPALKDGKPVAFKATVDVNFWLA